MAFEIQRFIERCREARTEADATRAIQEIVAEAVREPSSVVAGLGERDHAGPDVLYRAPDMTILDFAWAPWMPLKPHNHCMWSVVGIVTGREDNVFWRRTADSIEAAGARSLGAGDVTLLGPEIIHSVVNPIGTPTRAIHVYGGDFFAPPRPRSEWDPETLTEGPWDMADTRRLFAEAEARAATTRGQPTSGDVEHILTILAVEDLREAVAFYRAAFDWEPSVETAVYVEFTMEGGRRVGLYEREGFARNTGRTPTRIPAGEIGPTELYFRAEDLAAAIERFARAGARELSPLARRDWGDEAAYFADPSGNVLVLARTAP